MTSVSQVSDPLGPIVEEEANVLAKGSGFIQREQAFTGADLPKR